MVIQRKKKKKKKSTQSPDNQTVLLGFFSSFSSYNVEEKARSLLIWEPINIDSDHVDDRLISWSRLKLVLYGNTIKPSDPTRLLVEWWLCHGLWLACEPSFKGKYYQKVFWYGVSRVTIFTLEWRFTYSSHPIRYFPNPNKSEKHIL